MTYYLKPGEDAITRDGPEEEWRSLRALNVQPGDTVRHLHNGEKVIVDMLEPEWCRDTKGGRWYWDRPVWQLVYRATRKTRSVFYYESDNALAPTKLGTIELENGKPVRDSFKLEGED